MRENAIAVARRKANGAARGSRYVTITAPAKLVAACPEGMDWPIVAPTSVSTLGIDSNGLGRPLAALIPRAIRSADQTQAAVNASPKKGSRFPRMLTTGARRIQTRPA
jgi:hypothetical protein